MSRQECWFVFKFGKKKAGPFRDLYAAYRKAQQVKGDLVKAVLVSSKKDE